MMRVGDLISFKPINFGNEDWSNPCIVLKEYASPDTGLFVIWCDECFDFEIINESGRSGKV